ncbi:hypothetical protein GQ44DRAFT_733396 [Phaeosphaeriaceae sp. PMI808]|nr:hypothetical protein GQ44DRAFT_733396 [Phaeosphaeriaceae sp. PMI808]
MLSLSIVLALLGASSTLAAPMDPRIEDIQCRCLSFSTDAKPTLCTYLDSHNFDWHTASALASDYDLKLHFASESTITKVLSIHRPLPSSMLQSIHEGEVMPMDPEHLIQRENQFVCGFGDEIKHMGSRDSDGSLDPEECHFVGYVIGAFMILLSIYVAAEYVWSRFFAEGAIQLEDDHDIDHHSINNLRADSFCHQHAYLSCGAAACSGGPMT